MLIRRLLFVLLALVLVLTGCQEDPRKRAQADAIRLDSQVRATATIAPVRIEETRAAMAIAATATAIADEEMMRAETQAERIEREERIIKASARAVVGVIVAACVALSIVAIGSSLAASTKANLEARLIRIDPTTRTFPLLLEGDKQGNRYLINLETGERFNVTKPAPVNPGMLAISGQVRTTGLLAAAAEKIAKSTKSPQPGDMLPAIGQAVPLLDLPVLDGPWGGEVGGGGEGGGG